METLQEKAIETVESKNAPGLRAYRGVWNVGPTNRPATS